jgi:transposase InsO family protein
VLREVKTDIAQIRYQVIIVVKQSRASYTNELNQRFNTYFLSKCPYVSIVQKNLTVRSNLKGLSDRLAHWSHSLSVANVPFAVIHHWFCNRKRFNKADCELICSPNSST